MDAAGLAAIKKRMEALEIVEEVLTKIALKIRLDNRAQAATWDHLWLPTRPTDGCQTCRPSLD